MHKICTMCCERTQFMRFTLIISCRVCCSICVCICSEVADDDTIETIKKIHRLCSPPRFFRAAFACSVCAHSVFGIYCFLSSVLLDFFSFLFILHCYFRFPFCLAKNLHLINNSFHSCLCLIVCSSLVPVYHSKIHSLFGNNSSNVEINQRILMLSTNFVRGDPHALVASLNKLLSVVFL